MKDSDMMEEQEKKGLISLIVGMWLILLFTQAEVAFFFRAHMGIDPRIMFPLVITFSGLILLYGYLLFSK